MSRAQEENIAIKTVGENDEDNAYAIVDESKRKSKCDQEGPSSSEGGVQSPPNDDHTAAHQSALKQNTERCDKGDDQEEKRDHVYAEVFVKESKAAAGKTTASRDESLQVTCTEDGSNVGKDPVENLNPSSLEQGREMNSNEVTSEQDPLCSRIESNDHFYEVVDKSKKKRMAPKVGTFNYSN